MDNPRPAALNQERVNCPDSSTVNIAGSRGRTNGGIGCHRSIGSGEGGPACGRLAIGGLHDYWNQGWKVGMQAWPLTSPTVPNSSVTTSAVQEGRYGG